MFLFLSSSMVQRLEIMMHSGALEKHWSISKHLSQMLFIFHLFIKVVCFEHVKTTQAVCLFV